MSSTVCTCTTAGTPFNKRSARSGVVLHEHTTGGVVILVLSNAPKQWRVLVGNAEGWKTGKLNTDNMTAYHGADGCPTYALAEPDATAITAAIPDPMKAQMAYDLAYQQFVDSLAEAGVPVPATPKSSSGYTPRAKAVEEEKDFEPDSPNPDRYWFESDNDTRAFKDFVGMRRAGHDTNAIVVGPSGFGKTEGVKRLGERLGVPVHTVNCQVITTPEKWLGQMMADPTKGTYFEVSQHIKWIERDSEECQNSEFCIILYDEITRLRPELGNMLFSLLDGQQGLEVPQMNRTVHMARENVIFATANIGSAYAGTFAMDWALRGRFDFTVERPFPPSEEEVKVLVTANPKLSEEKARQMIDVAEHSRILWKNGELESPISTRLLLSWGRLVAGGYSIKDAAEYTVIPVYTEDGGADSDRAKIKMALDLKVSA